MSSITGVNAIEKKINIVLDRIIMFYLNNTDNGKQIQKLLDLYAKTFDAYMRLVPREKLLAFLQKQSEIIDKTANKLKDINQLTDKLNKIIKDISKIETKKIQAYLPSLPYRFKKWWYEHDINPFSAIWNDMIMRLFLPYTKTHEYKRDQAKQQIERIKQDVHTNFSSVEGKWFAERFSNGIQERDIINNSNSVISLLDNNIKQAISFNVFEPRGDYTTYNICISKDKNGGYIIGGCIGIDIFNEDCSFKKKYDKNGELLDKTENPTKTNQTQEKISKVIDSVHDEFRNSKFDINVMYKQLEKHSLKQLNLAGKNLLILKDSINMATMENKKIRIKKIFNSPGFGYYPISLTTTREEIGKIIK